jgi:DHA1 family tetracycline resistance protein-like MFS transporter
MPVLPGLLRDIVHSDSIASHYGVLLALYALMQFLCAPVLGALSDRFGRRPVLLATWSHYRLRDHGDHTRPVDIRI